MMEKKASYLEHAAVTVADIDWSLELFQEKPGAIEKVLGIEVK